MSGHQKQNPRPRQVRLAAVVVGMILLALIWGGFFITTYVIQRNFETNAVQNLKTESLYIDDHLNRAFQQIGTTLTTARSLLRILEPDESLITDSTLSSMLGNNHLIRHLSLLNADGKVLASSDPENVNAVIPINALLETKRINNVSREGIIYGTVLPYRDLQEWSRQTASPTRELLPAVLAFSIGNQDYSLVATINPAFFTGFWERIDHSPHTEIAIFDYNGNKFLSYQEQPVPSNTVFYAIENEGKEARIGHFFLTNQRDFLIAFRANDRYPQITALITNLKPARALVEADIRRLLMFTIIGSMLVLIILVLTYRLYLRYERSTIYSQTLLEGITAHVMMSRADRDGKIIEVNTPFLAAFGYEREELIGQNHQMITKGLQTPSDYEQLWETIQTGKIWRGTFRNRTKNGQLIWLNSTIFPVPNEWGEVSQYVTLYSDINHAIQMSEEIERERSARRSVESLNQELKNEITRDALTGCWNRRGLDQFLKALSSDDNLSHSPVSVLMLDLDHFKDINDNCGHHVGDLILKACVKTWQASIRSSDLVVRLGGEEFAVLLLRNTIDEAYAIAEKLRKATEAIKLKVPGRTDPVRITVSIGVGHTNNTTKESIDALMIHADKALYAAKEDGRNRVKRA